MKIDFRPNHVIIAVLKTLLFIAIVSCVDFGVNALAKVETSATSYTLMMAFSAIFLHYYDKEDEK